MTIFILHYTQSKSQIERKTKIKFVEENRRVSLQSWGEERFLRQRTFKKCTRLHQN